MINPLYWVSAMIYALVLGIILLHDHLTKTEPGKEEKAFRLLLKWVIFFCLQDSFWGLCGGSLIQSDRLFFLASTVFHLSTVTTTFFWLYYILTYLSERIKGAGILLRIDGLVVGLQALLLIANYFRPVIFEIRDGLYVTGFLRPLAFLNQYLVYLLISVFTAFHILTAKKQQKDQYVTVFFFSLAPVLSGIFQLLYPDGPFYSIGYFLGCFIIHIFVVMRDRSTLERLNASEVLERQKNLSKTDSLTGLLNRRAFEDDILEYPSVPSEADFIYLTADINELKIVNDTLGHAAGDELIIGASECLKRCLGAYGKVYRIGGDEFAAILFAGEEKVPFLKQDLKEAAQNWRGRLAEKLAFSVGIVRHTEFSDLNLTELIRIADQRMYRDKELYYSRKGIDPRLQQSAFTALCNSYTKVLKVNLTRDSYRIIWMDENEQTVEKGFADSISSWLHGFGLSGQVHPEDLESYLRKTDLCYLKTYFNTGRNLTLFYRRKSGEAYRRIKMELLPAEDYSPENQSLYLFVKDIDAS